MHTQPIPESSGEFTAETQQLTDCPYCNQKACVKWRTWESSCGGYEDEKAQCTKCGKVWWIEGIDS